MKLLLSLALPCAAALAACQDASGADPNGHGDTGISRATETESAALEPPPSAADDSARGDEPPPATETRASGTNPAGEVFWTAFNAGRYDDLDAVQRSLTKAVDATPTDGYLRRLLGVSFFWQTAEGSRERGGLLRGPVAAVRATRALEAAKAQAPADPWLPCFLGILEYEIGASTGRESSKAAGLAELARGIELYPEFNTYCRALARGSEPRGSSGFSAALVDFWRVIELCDPSVTRASPTVTDPSRMAGCTQRARVPHGYNGIWMTLGDVMAKSGDARLARAFYENAKLLAYDSWPERARLEARLASVDDDVRRWTDGEPGNDPTLAFHSDRACVMCHAR